MKKTFEIVSRKLKKDCFLLINIANVTIGSKVYDLENITIDTAKEVGFNYEGYKIMEMARVPSLNKKYKTEKIFIFKNVKRNPIHKGVSKKGS